MGIPDLIGIVIFRGVALHSLYPIYIWRKIYQMFIRRKRGGARVFCTVDQGIGMNMEVKFLKTMGYRF
jgi:hypothetical protein